MRTMHSLTARAVALAAVASLGLAACSSGSSGGSTGATSAGAGVKGGTLNMLGTTDVDYMDPNISYYTPGYMAARMYSRQLYTYPADPKNATKSVPDLATGTPTVSADGKTITVTIQQGAMWDTSPARQITATDEIYGVKRTCNPAQPFGGLPDYIALIVGFQAFCDGFAKVSPTAAAITDYINSHDVAGLKQGSDDRTVVFTLTHPASFFTDMLTLTAFSPAPKEYQAYVPGSPELAQHTIADGPYKITTYTPTKQIVLDRNPAWNAATDSVRKAWVDKVVVSLTSTQESIQQQLQTGTPSADMEFVTFPPPSQYPSLIASKDPNFSLGFTGSSNPYIVYNFKSPNNGSIMNKLAFRQGLMYGINRAHIVQALGGPTVDPPLTHVLPTAIVGGSPDFDPYPYNPDKAKQLFAQAGLQSGATLKMLYRSSSQGVTKTFETVQQDLKAYGINVVGVASPDADFYTKYLEVPSVAARGVWDLAIAGWGPDWYGNAALSYFNPLFYGQTAFPPSGSNFGFYNNPATNQLILQAGTAATEDQAATLWHQADQAVMNDAAFFPITSDLQPTYHAKQVHNAVYIPGIQGEDPTNAWLDPAVNGG